MRRRDFLKGMLCLGLGSVATKLGTVTGKGLDPRKKVLVLGIDGMDPRLTERFMRQGLMPHFDRLARTGSMSVMRTSTPPQSPTAWSNFIVGAPSQLHGIYDFIHRDPQTMVPYLSTSAVLPPETNLNIGPWKIPLAKGRVESLRQGKPFWDLLAEGDIPVTLFKMPANFPCESNYVRMVSGMGTPDLRGGYGSYTLFTTAPKKFRQDISGGIIVPVHFHDGVSRTELSGPENSLRNDHSKSRIPIEIWRDPVNEIVRILIQNRELLLQKGEWSGWIPLAFQMIDPVFHVKGIVKLFVKNVHPEFHMYVSPINIDPSDPMLPVVSQKEYGRDLVRNVGYFYTQGFPEDTKALSEGIFTEEEYIDLAYQILAEREALLDYEFERFNRQESGLLFFYFSSLDQDTHMYYRTIDLQHPLYDPKLGREYGDFIPKLYTEMDRILGKLVSDFDIKDPNNTIIVMSDHGFVSFRRQVNLNNWLYENGFLSVAPGRGLESREYLANVQWSKTAAYNIGINSVYLNRAGREEVGILSEIEAEATLKTIREKLLQIVDPETGNKAVFNVWIVPKNERYLNPHAPDLVVGWNEGYRTSWVSILGGFSKQVFEDNLDKWSGDHCVDHSLVPAILVTNQKTAKTKPELCDLTVSILGRFSVPGDKRMTGMNILS